MFQVVPKWKVVVTLSDGSEHIVWINDNFISSVLHKVAEMQFAESGLIQPTKIVIGG